MTFMALLRRISKNNRTRVSKKVGDSNVKCYCGQRSVTQGIVMVPMKNKVLQFPKPSSTQTDARIDEPHIVFSLGDVRLALQYNLIPVNYKPAEVISISKRSPRKVGKPTRASR
jgi:hypothetical protein